MARFASPALSGDRAEPSGLGQFSSDRRHGLGRRSRLSLSRPRRRAGASGCGPGRRLLWRLGRGRDHGALDRALLSPGSGRSARRQIRRPRRSRHHRYARNAAGRISEARLGRSGQRRHRFHCLAGERACRHRARPRGLRALWLEALHAQPAATALAAPDRSADLAAVGRRRPDRDARLWRRLAPGNPGCAARTDPRRRPFPALGTARSLCRKARRLRRRQCNRRAQCASGISRKWPTTRPGKRG